jgi:hypothetical protein
MFNKQPAGYLYHVLPSFGVLLSFINYILHWYTDLAVVMEAHLCTWDNETGIMTPQDNQIDGIMSDVHSFQDILAVSCTTDSRKPGRKKDCTAPKMCFRLSGNHSIQTIQGANNGKYTKTTKPGAEPGVGTQASAVAPAPANKPLVKLHNISDGKINDEFYSGSSSLLSITSHIDKDIKVVTNL